MNLSRKGTTIQSESFLIHKQKLEGIHEQSFGKLWIRRTKEIYDLYSESTMSFDFSQMKIISRIVRLLFNENCFAYCATLFNWILFRTLCDFGQINFISHIVRPWLIGIHFAYCTTLVNWNSFHAMCYFSQMTLLFKCH